MLPTLLVWALGPLSLAECGRATGVWFSCVTTAQFACPLAVLAIGAVAGGLSGALVVLGVLAVAAGRIRTA